jgi:hypothetical protein
MTYREPFDGLVSMTEFEHETLVEVRPPPTNRVAVLPGPRISIASGGSESPPIGQPESRCREDGPNRRGDVGGL